DTKRYTSVTKLVCQTTWPFYNSHTHTRYVTSAYVCNVVDCNYTIFKSTDGGLSWARSDTGTPFSYASTPVVDPINSQNIYISAYSNSTGSSGLFKSTNGGASWNEIGGAVSGSIQYVAIDSTHANIIYGGGDGVFKITERGGMSE